MMSSGVREREGWEDGERDARVANGTTMGGDALHAPAYVCPSVMLYLDHFRSSTLPKNELLNQEHVSKEMRSY